MGKEKLSEGFEMDLPTAKQMSEYLVGFLERKIRSFWGRASMTLPKTCGTIEKRARSFKDFLYITSASQQAQFKKLNNLNKSKKKLKLKPGSNSTLKLSSYVNLLIFSCQIKSPLPYLCNWTDNSSHMPYLSMIFVSVKGIYVHYGSLLELGNAELYMTVFS